MKLTVKSILDLGLMKQDPEAAKEFLAEKAPFRVALVRNQTVLISKEVTLKRDTDITKMDISLGFDYPCDKTPGLYLAIGKNLPEDIFLSAEPFKIWIGPESFKDGVADLAREKVTLPGHIFRRWLLLCREYTITGRVVKRVQMWDPIEQMYVHCDEPVPGAKVEAFDVDCWWFWMKRNLAGSATTNPDGTFTISFRWCCLLQLPRIRPRWVIDPSLLRRITEAIKPHIGPIPPEVLKSPTDFENFLGISREMSVKASPPVQEMRTSSCGGNTISTDRVAISEQKTVAPARLIPDQIIQSERIIDKIRLILPILPCHPFRTKDCTPDIVFKVTQECEGEVNVIYDENPFQTRWNIPTNLNVILMANDTACSIPVCEEPPIGNCLKLMWVNCLDIRNIGTTAGPPDLRGYANPGIDDNPFAGSLYIKGRFGDSSTVDYFKVQYAFNDGLFKDLPEEHLQAFTRSYLAPPPSSPPGSPAVQNRITFKPELVDGQVVYKTLKKVEQENPLPPGWHWGYLWNDYLTLFRWNSKGLDGDGLYTLRLLGYRLDTATNTLTDEQVMKSCEVKTGSDEQVMIRIDNRESDDPIYEINEDRPCGAGTIHLCTYEPDCDFRHVEVIRRDESGTISGAPMSIGPCDIIELSDNDDIVIHFTASVPKNSNDGHLLAYSLHAHWGEDLVFNAINSLDPSITLEPDSDTLIGPSYNETFAGSQLIHRNSLPATHLEHDRPYWFGGNFMVSIQGNKFNTCAYTLALRVWKRTIEGCTNPRHVHVNWCSYSFTIKKV